ncbi:hypothetical protein WA026_015911 [Henosepilachna vigintioctopunctata]|uniref:Uncharacterized protein n=1 Tax=Henosepilachna vigintioctopunctata TaxID=420089 RepID=A0AAW1U885_9CUCU
MFSIELTESSSCNTLIRNFFSQISVKTISFEKLFPSIFEYVQEEIVNKTVNCTLILKYPINISYQKQFLKAFIEYLEKQNSTVADCVFDAFGRLVALPYPSSNFCYTYHLIAKNENSGCIPLILLKENINIISEGTTGLKVWQASQMLAEWVLQNPTYVENRKILELGSGIGLTGLIVSNLAKPSKYILTDCHPTVLSVLSDNVKLNTNMKPEDCDVINVYSLVNPTSIEVKELFWEKTNTDSCKTYGAVDLIFAADVVYDSDIFQPLLNTVKIFLLNGTKEAIFACTERNTETLKCFWNACDLQGLKIEFLQPPEPQHLYWQSDIPIVLAKIKLSDE